MQINKNQEGNKLTLAPIGRVDTIEDDRRLELRGRNGVNAADRREGQLGAFLILIDLHIRSLV